MLTQETPLHGESIRNHEVTIRAVSRGLSESICASLYLSVTRASLNFTFVSQQSPFVVQYSRDEHPINIKQAFRNLSSLPSRLERALARLLIIRSSSRYKLLDTVSLHHGYWKRID